MRITQLETPSNPVKATPNGPLATVVMGTFNRPKLLKNAIQSVVNQNYQNWELMVVNDGGEDVSHIISRFRDSRIKYFNMPANFGAAHSYNYGIYESKGKYITYLADDDIYYPNHLELLVDTLEKNPQYGGAYSDQYQVDCDLNDGEYTAIHKKWVRFSFDFDKITLIGMQNFIPHPCFMHRRELLYKAGWYDEKQKVLIDFDLLRRMAFYTDFIHVKEITGEYYFPINKKERITDISTKDPQMYQECTIRSFSKVPEKPWDRLETLNIVLYAESLTSEILNQLKFLVQYIFLPKKIFLVLNQYSSNENSVFDKLPIAKLILNSKSTGLLDTFRNVRNFYCQLGWSILIDEQIHLNEEWLKNLYGILRQILVGNYQNPKDLETNCIYIENNMLKQNA